MRLLHVDGQRSFPRARFIVFRREPQFRKFENWWHGHRMLLWSCWLTPAIVARLPLSGSHIAAFANERAD